MPNEIWFTTYEVNSQVYNHHTVDKAAHDKFNALLRQARVQKIETTTASSKGWTPKMMTSFIHSH